MPEIEDAFLAGAPRTAAAGPPPRLVLVGEVPLDVLDATVGRVAAAIGVAPDDVDLAFFRPADWRARVADGNPYVADLLAAPRTPLRGEGPNRDRIEPGAP